MPEDGGAKLYAPMQMDAAADDGASDSEAALAIMKQKAKRFEFVFGALAAILVMWIGSAIFSSPPATPQSAVGGAPAPPPSRWVAPVAISSELRVWDPEAVEFFQLPRPSGSGATHGYYSFPSYRNGVLVFVSEGDIWRAPDALAGGLAARLTSRGFVSTHAPAPSHHTLDFPALRTAARGCRRRAPWSTCSCRRTAPWWRSPRPSTAGVTRSSCR